MDLGIEGKVALVTGGSQGIGRAIAHGLANEGVRVAVCGRTKDIVHETAEQIEAETGTPVLPVVADVLVPNDIERFVAETLERFGTIDIAINNADLITRDVGFFELQDEDWQEKMNMKLFAPIRLIRLVAPIMQQNGWGRIINIGGSSARKVHSAGWAKGATQPGLINLTKRLSWLLGHDGITVNLVEPGIVWTEGHTRMDGKSRAESRSEDLARRAEREGVSYDEMDRRARAELVIGRRIEPDDVASVVVFLSSTLTGALTGETILVDGGEMNTVRF
ncbi:SDR family NAD(P)-dependent oxidoreductase [Monashia sp. NPDC004114]